MASPNGAAVTPLSDADVFGGGGQGLSDAEVFGGAPPPVSPVTDVAKSAVSGAGSGLVGIAGLPGDLATWIGGVARKAVQYMNPKATPEELDKKEAAFWNDMSKPENMQTMAWFGGGMGVPAPPLTSGDIQNEVEKSTGKFYQPQTTAGEYAHTVGSFLPGAAAGGEGIIPNAVKFALLPGAASQFSGDYFKGTPLEGPARFIGGLIGGGAGIAASKGAEAVQNFNAARNAASDIGDVNAGAVSRMAKSYQADQLTPQIVAQRQAALGPEAMTLDMGRQMQGRGEAIASQPGEGQNTVLNAVQSRVHGVDPQTGLPNEAFGAATADRIKDTLDAQLGVSHNKVDLLNGVSDIVNRVSKPLYDSVMEAHPVVNVPDSITSRPAVASAMKNATTLAKQYGEQLESPPETQTIVQGPGYHIAEDVAQPAQTSLRYWDYVKKDLDRRVNAYMKSGGASELNSADKADLGGLIDARNALRDNLDAQTNGQYAQARQAWSFKPDLTEAYETGRGAFNSKLLPEEFAQQVNDMSTPEQVMAKAGYRRELENLIDVARNDGAKARGLLDTNSNQQKIEALFGPDARQAVEDRIGAETRFQSAANNIAANSRTGVRTQLVKDTESPSLAAPPMANIGGLAYKGATSAADYLRGMNTERTRAAIGRMATAQGPQLRNLAEVLSRYNAQKAANASTPLLRQGGGLARALALNPSLGAQPSPQAQP